MTEEKAKLINKLKSLLESSYTKEFAEAKIINLYKTKEIDNQDMALIMLDDYNIFKYYHYYSNSELTKLWLDIELNLIKNKKEKKPIDVIL